MARNVPATAGSRDRNRGGQRVNRARIDADKLRSIRILGGGADRSAERGKLQEHLQSHEQHDCDHKYQYRQMPDIDFSSQDPAIESKIAYVRCQ